MKDLRLDLFAVGFKFVDVSEALAQLDSLLRRDCPVNSSLDFRDRRFAAGVYKRRDIKGFARMIEDITGNRTCRLSKNITENVIKLQVGDSQAVLCTVLFAGEHIGELEAVAHQVTKLADFGGRDKTWFYHIAHEQVSDPFGILAVGLIALLRFGIFGMGQSDKTGLFKDVKNRDPVLASGFHTDFSTGIFGKPGS